MGEKGLRRHALRAGSHWVTLCNLPSHAGGMLPISRRFGITPDNPPWQYLQLLQNLWSCRRTGSKALPSGRSVSPWPLSHLPAATPGPRLSDVRFALLLGLLYIRTLGSKTESGLVSAAKSLGRPGTRPSVSLSLVSPAWLTWQPVRPFIPK